MVPVHSFGVDSGILTNSAQLLGVLITSVLTLVTVVATVIYARNRRIIWPVILLVTGGITCVMEPLFDHLYGLWFFTKGQWTAFETYGISVPVWLPIVYVAYYGAWTVWLTNRWQRGATPAQVTKLYLASVAIAFSAEQFYIQVLGLYNYQDSQPLYVAGYPVWVTFVNGVPPFLASLIYVRLIPLLKRKWEYLSLLVIVPICFAADSFGGGFLYLAYRHSSETPNMAVLTVLAVLTAFTSYAMVMLAGRLIGLDKSRSIAPKPVRPEAVEVP